VPFTVIRKTERGTHLLLVGGEAERNHEASASLLTLSCIPEVMLK
jgi:hypothetical protein